VKAFRHISYSSNPKEVSTIKSDPKVGSKENFYKSDASKGMSHSVPFVSSYLMIFVQSS